MTSAAKVEEVYGATEYVYLDKCVDLIDALLCCGVGTADELLLTGLRTDNSISPIVAERYYGPGNSPRIGSDEWRGGKLNLERSRENIRQGKPRSSELILSGEDIHLHRVAVRRDVLDDWLNGLAAKRQADGFEVPKHRPAPEVVVEFEPCEVEVPCLGTNYLFRETATTPLADFTQRQGSVDQSGMGVTSTSPGPEEATNVIAKTLPVSEEDFRNTRDPVPLLKKWMAWKYPSAPYPSRDEMLEHFRDDYGKIIGISEKQIRAARINIVPEYLKRGGASTHRQH